MVQSMVDIVNEVGLAAQQMQQPTQMTVGQVVSMLTQGVSPEELVAQGVPEELVQQAMMVIMRQQQPEQVGLAGMQVEQGVE